LPHSSQIGSSHIELAQLRINTTVAQVANCPHASNVTCELFVPLCSHTIAAVTAATLTLQLEPSHTKHVPQNTTEA